MSKTLPPPNPEAQIVLDYDRTEFRYPGIYMMSFRAWQVDKSPGIPHGVRYAFNLFAPDSQGSPNTSILRFDNEHAPTGTKHPYDHWHPPQRGPGGRLIEVKGEKPLKENLADLPTTFIEKSYALLEEIGVDINNGIQSLGPERVASPTDNPSPARSATAKAKSRRKK
jgi:Family of unknown function (DUF6516)